MKKLFPVLCVLILILTIPHCFAQIKTQEAKLTDLPANAYKGKVVKSLSWADKNGDSMLVLTEIPPFLSQKRKGEDDYYDAELLCLSLCQKRRNLSASVESYRFCSSVYLGYYHYFSNRRFVCN